MSCNGCRVLRKGCSESCILRSCLHWIETPESQGNATLFLAKFFGRSDLLSFISAVPESQRPALFQSLLYEACGRTVNPVNGAVGLLSSGNWHVCEVAVQTVLNGGALRPLPEIFNGVLTPNYDESSQSFFDNAYKVQNMYQQSTLPFMVGNQASDLSLSLTPRRGGGGGGGGGKGRGYQVVERRERNNTVSFCGDESDMTSFESGVDDRKKERELLNLFV